MRVRRLLDSLATRGDAPCLIWRGETLTYRALDELRRRWRDILGGRNIAPGAVVGIKADHSPNAVALLLALLEHGCVAALIPATAPDEAPYLHDAQAEALCRFDADGEGAWQAVPGRHPTVRHRLLQTLAARREAGFIIFSSGSTGQPKAILHSAERFLAKFDRPGKRLRTLAFLLFDHIAGIDTLFYTLAGGGTLVLPERRDPLSVCRLIQDHEVEVLPTSPTFLNLLCLSGDHAGFDLSSLKIITYGSEPMSAATLARLGEIFPGIDIVQKYGTSEFGAPRARSRGRDSLYLKLKDDEIEARIVDSVLWVRTPTAMLGYLNAPNPFDEDGWYCTGDVVEQDGDWIRILGRQSDIIIVGGEKVYPQEVEAVILELDSIEDAVVRGEAHPFMGHIVTAEVTPRGAADEAAVRKEVRRHCRARLAPYKVPAKVRIAQGPLATERQKKIRQ